MEIADIVYKEEEIKMEKTIKFRECIRCVHSDNPWRCACCYNADKFSPIEKTITTEKEYHKMSKPQYVSYKTMMPSTHFTYRLPSIRKVIFSGRATIVFWEDNTKTVVKCDKEDVYDPHTGLAEAIAKKTLGDDYRRLFRKYIKQYNKQQKKEFEKAIKALEVENARLETDIEVNEALSDVMKTFHKDDAE